jgi:alpha-tubulin suppressor-like RCC1 family protein
MCLIPRRRPALVATLIATCLTSLLGIGVASAPAAMTMIPSGATAVSAGDRHACAIVTSGGVECWGNNSLGQLGDGTTNTNSYISSPVTVSGLSGVTAISAGGDFTCSLLPNETVMCWGHNGYGQLGDGTKMNRTTPVAVSGLSGVIAIAAGLRSACALLSGGVVKCWGDNFNGELGNGTKGSPSTTPVTVSGLNGASAVSVGNSHACAVVAAGAAKCWGENSDGQLGDGTKGDSTAPVAVSALSGATAISAGVSNTCALLTSGAVSCWGLGAGLGNGTTTPNAYSSIPVAVSDLSGGVAISAGAIHTCALLVDGALKCWGNNYDGQLGADTGDLSAEVPVVANIGNVIAVDAGSTFTCVLLPGGAVECWGSWYGPLEALTHPPMVPVAKITLHPRRETADRHAVFAFTGEPGGSYECSIDAGRWRPCTSGQDLGPLAPGDHRFRVRETLAGLTGPADSYAWTIVLPRACVLKWARARVSIPTHRNRARLVIHYKAYKPARVTVSYALKGRKGSLRLGTASARFKTLGFYRRGKRLGKGGVAKLRATKSMTVRFSIPQAPAKCTRYYTKRLTISHHPRPGLTVWFQSDSVFGVGW